MGHHPYYPRTAQTRVYADVQGMWHADADVLPTHLGPHPAVDALRHGMSPDAFDLDNNFANWSREATIAWPDEHRQLTMTADAPFDHMVVFAPANDPQLCVEPVTNTTDCFNTVDMQEHVGGCVLQPGEEIAAALTWTPSRG
jgi:aldose 1-epimerase